MFGFSVFMTDEIDHETEGYIGSMKAQGFQGIFTSAHIPEEDPNLYKERLEKLSTFSRKYDMELMVDVSGKALKKMGLSFDRPEEILDLGITGLRMDFGIDNKLIANLTKSLKIALNASTFSQEDLDELRDYGANFSNTEMWHNYYPRPYTGLDPVDFKEKNLWLKSLGFKLVAFVPGDKDLRGPLFEGLPSLEEHRYSHPLAASLDLIYNYSLDHVYIGDPGLSQKTRSQFSSYTKNQTLDLYARSKSPRYFKYILGRHRNRWDSARDAIRSDDARLRDLPPIEQEFSGARKLGDLTIDNLNFGRYMGEMQIVKNSLPKDFRVNTVGEIIDEDLDIIKHIKGGDYYCIIQFE